MGTGEALIPDTKICMSYTEPVALRGPSVTSVKALLELDSCRSRKPCCRFAVGCCTLIVCA